MLKQRNEVGESLVKGLHVRIARLGEARMNAVEQGVRDLVRHDVVRQAGEHRVARRIVGVLAEHGKIAEQQRLLVGTVIGVLIAQRMRIDPQPADELTLPLAGRALAGRDAARRPQRDATERPLELADRGHRDGVDHLLMELRIPLRRTQTVLREHVRVVEVHRRIDHAARRIDVDHLDVFTRRAGLQVLPRQPDRDLVNRNGLQPQREAGIERIHTQTPVRRHT
jgi:hypothetical protein